MANESTAFGTWWKENKEKWTSKASEVLDNLWETKEEKEEAKKTFEKKVTEEADKTIDTDYEELSKEDKEAYDIKRFKIYEEMKAKEEKEDATDKEELAQKLEGIKEVINTFENFQTGEPGTQIAGYQDVEDPYSGTSALSDLQEKESQKALLAQITGYNNPMSRAVDLEKRLTNLVRYT